MLLEKFKEKLIYKKFQRELRKTPEVRDQNSKKIRSIAILTTQEIYSEIDIVNLVQENFKSLIKVQVYCFRNYKKSDEKSYKHFSEKDLDVRGSIKEPSLHNFLDDSFDLLIGFFDKNHLYLEYAALKSKATFKVGLAEINDKIYDLVISEKVKNTKVFIDVMKKYLQILNKI